MSLSPPPADVQLQLNGGGFEAAASHSLSPSASHSLSPSGRSVAPGSKAVTMGKKGKSKK